MNYLSNFRKAHSIDKKANLSSIQVSLEGISEANNLAFEYISNIDTSEDAVHFELNTHINLIGRIFEQVEGMLATIAINCPTSSEALGRVVIEGSINLMYMANFGDEKTLLAFFSSWVNEHQRKLAEWSEKVEEKEYNAEIQKMISKRLIVVNLYNDFIQQGIEKFDVDINSFPKIWPKSIFKRFEALGKEESYYENYHRLSGANHLTAEDTLSWLISLNFDHDQKIELANEAWSYSIMMSRLSSLFFIDALASSCIHFGLKDGDTLNRLKEIKDKIKTSVQVISLAAGVPKV